MTETYLERHDPVRKARRVAARKPRLVTTPTSSTATLTSAPMPMSTPRLSPVTTAPSSSTLILAPTPLHAPSTPTPSSRSVTPPVVRRTHLPARLRHALALRDGNRCVHRYVDGSRCEEKQWLHFHHRTPVSLGGKHELPNLQTLCERHHAMQHLSTEKRKPVTPWYPRLGHKPNQKRGNGV